MRINALLVATSLVAVTAFGCGEADTSSPYARGPARNASPPPVGSPDEHDPSDVGDGDLDPGNPNANTRPEPPNTSGAAAPEFALTLSDDTPTVGLGEEVTIDVVVEGIDGFSGDVDLSVTGLPPGATASTAKATIPAGATASAPTKITIRAGFDAIPSAPGTSSPISIAGTSGQAAASANANFKVAPRFTLTIPLNVDALRAANVQYRDEWGEAFGQNPTPLRTQQGNGIVVTVFNADSKPHVLHGANGFAHGDVSAPIQPNAYEMQNGNVRTRTLNPGTNANGYLHEGTGGVGASFRIIVEEAP